MDNDENKMINLSKEMDNDDGLDDLIICDSMDKYHIQKKQKYEHSSKTNQSWVSIDEPPPGLKSYGNYKYLYAEGKYGSVWHYIEHSRIEQSKKHNFWKVSTNNKAHSSGMIRPKSAIQINIKRKFHL